MLTEEEEAGQEGGGDEEEVVHDVQFIGTGHHELKKNNRDESKRKLLCSPN